MKGLGVLLPVASIPGGFRGSYGFVNWLAKTRQSYWQVLPLNPRDSFGSPYNSPKPFAVDKEYGTEKEWFDLKNYANKKGVKIIGDLPYFVGEKKKNLFLPELFSGAPPDSFSKKGQWWGHSLYDWETKYRENLNYLLKRLKRACELYDIVRWDHFRGYCGVWAIPKGLRSGRKGSWLKVPGEKILSAVRAKFPHKIFIAEDLGFITEEVKKLRKEFQFLGTRVVQFERTDEKDVIYYTSTHDTPTLVGFAGKEKAIKLIHEVLNSQALIKMTTVQDLLLLDNTARFNHPGKVKNNWKWKVANTTFPNNPLAFGQWCTFPQ